MRKLGFDMFCLAGHDRGARVSRRLAKDHPGQSLTVGDPRYRTNSVYPIRTQHASCHQFVALVLFIQPAPLPELSMGPSAEVWVKGMARLLKSPSEIEVAYVKRHPEIRMPFLRCVKTIEPGHQSTLNMTPTTLEY